MLFYGDRRREADPRQVFEDLSERLEHRLAMPPGLARHAALTTSLIEWGELLQGVADAFSDARGFDHDGPGETVLADWLLAIAHELRLSFDSLCWKGRGRVSGLPRPKLPERVGLRAPEGYLHYAVYPETYRVAASRGDQPLAAVIGIRSIGTSLAATVAAASGRGKITTVRPRSEPYRRRMVADAALTRRLTETDGAVALVDEGPGLSGSSFMAVADWLEQGGVARGRIHVFPSHDGPPGPEASSETRERWPGFSRHVASFEDVFLETRQAPHRLTTWVAEAVGPLEGPLEDLSGGRWRAGFPGPEERWPPAIPAMERRKYRAVAGGRRVLVKFAGLGAIGERKLAAARALAAAGFTPEPAALLHGFLVEQWLTASAHRSPLDLPRPELLARLADYLGFRARSFPAAADEGASLAELTEMAVYNTAVGLGSYLGERLARGLAGLSSFAPDLSRCATDNRLQPYEWLVAPDGRLVKTDALDHAFGHDLIGCQDIAWDLAGSSVEFALCPEERETLAARVERAAGRMIPRDLVRLLEPCYLACELARLHFGLAMTGDLAERMRLSAARQRYAGRLREWIVRSE